MVVLVVLTTWDMHKPTSCYMAQAWPWQTSPCWWLQG